MEDDVTNAATRPAMTPLASTPDRPSRRRATFLCLAPWAALSLSLMLATEAGATPEPGHDLVSDVAATASALAASSPAATPAAIAATTAAPQVRRRTRVRYRKLQALLHRFAEEARVAAEARAERGEIPGVVVEGQTRRRLARVTRVVRETPLRVARRRGPAVPAAPATAGPEPVAPPGTVAPSSPGVPAELGPSPAVPSSPRRPARAVPATLRLPDDATPPARTPAWISPAPETARGPLRRLHRPRVARIAAAVELDADPLLGQ
jgi:hypothetical protein